MLDRLISGAASLDSGMAFTITETMSGISASIKGRASVFDRFSRGPPLLSVCILFLPIDAVDSLAVQLAFFPFLPATVIDRSFNTLPCDPVFAGALRAGVVYFCIVVTLFAASLRNCSVDFLLSTSEA